MTTDLLFCFEVTLLLMAFLLKAVFKRVQTTNKSGQNTDASLEHLFIRSRTNSLLCTILWSDYGDNMGEWSNPVGDCSNHTSICVVWVEP